MKERPDCWINDGCLDIRDREIALPDGVERCYACGGNGKYVQRYIEGRLTGGCDCCGATGFVYKGTARGVPESVTNQIAVANNLNCRMFGLAWGIDWSLSPHERNHG